jgi:hypothetical protein
MQYLKLIKINIAPQIYLKLIKLATILSKNKKN